MNQALLADAFTAVVLNIFWGKRQDTVLALLLDLSDNCLNRAYFNTVFY
jgi:hypothetical protein